MGTKPVPAILLTAALQLVGVACWSWASGTVLRLYATAGQTSGSWLMMMLIGVAGAVIAGLAGLTTKLAPTGLIVVGAIHVLAAGVLTLVPVRISGSINPIVSLTMELRSIDQALSDGLIVFIAAGTALLLGAAMIGLALAVRPARQSTATSSGVGSSIGLGLAAAVLAIGALVASGWSYLRIFMHGQTSIASALISLLLAAGVVACMASMRVPRTGGLIAAVAVVLVGLMALSPSTVFSIGLPTQVVSILVTVGGGGGFVMCGVAVALLCLTVRSGTPATSWYSAGPTDSPDATEGSGSHW